MPETVEEHRVFICGWPHCRYKWLPRKGEPKVCARCKRDWHGPSARQVSARMNPVKSVKLGISHYLKAGIKTYTRAIEDLQAVGVSAAEAESYLKKLGLVL